jgi:signal transduction histidine kinase
MKISVSEHFRRLYILALSSVAFLTILGQILIQVSLRSQSYDSWLINRAGRQRFQSQYIAKSVLLLKHSRTHADTLTQLNNLKKVLSNWERYHHLLISGNIEDFKIQVANSDSIQRLFSQIDPHFRVISENTRQLMGMFEEPASYNEAEAEKCINNIFANEDIFLSMMDKIVFQYDKEAKEKVEKLKNTEFLLLSITLIVLLAEGLFIFRPAVSMLSLTIQQLTEAEKSTKAANFELQSANHQLQYINQLVEESNSQLAISNKKLEESNSQLAEANEKLTDSNARLADTQAKLLHESALRHEQEVNQQKLSTAALIQGQEEERKRISRELHDGLGQMLTGLKLLSEGIKSSDLLPEKEQRLFKDLKNLVLDTIQETRSISNNLMPAVLSDFGIESALRDLTDQYAKNSEAELSFHSNLNGKRFDKNYETGIYRIAQEALHNAIKHSQADAIYMEILLKNNYLELMIEDNGIGFKKTRGKKPKNGASQGLSNIQERARLMNAQVEIISGVGEGTKIWLSLALKN